MMPLQNRVLPKGSLIVVNVRAVWMGNCAIQHNSVECAIVDGIGVDAGMSTA